MLMRLIDHLGRLPSNDLHVEGRAIAEPLGVYSMPQVSSSCLLESILVLCHQFQRHALELHFHRRLTPPCDKALFGGC